MNLVPCRLVAPDRLAYDCPSCGSYNTPTLATCHEPGGWGLALGVYRYSTCIYCRMLLALATPAVELTCIYCRMLLALATPAVEPKKGPVSDKTTQDATQALHPPPLPT